MTIRIMTAMMNMRMDMLRRKEVEAIGKAATEEEYDDQDREGEEEEQKKQWEVIKGSNLKAAQLVRHLK